MVGEPEPAIEEEEEVDEYRLLPIDISCEVIAFLPQKVHNILAQKWR